MKGEGVGDCHFPARVLALGFQCIRWPPKDILSMWTREEWTSMWNKLVVYMVTALWTGRVTCAFEQNVLSMAGSTAFVRVKICSRKIPGCQAIRDRQRLDLESHVLLSLPYHRFSWLASEIVRLNTYATQRLPATTVPPTTSISSPWSIHPHDIAHRLRTFNS